MQILQFAHFSLDIKVVKSWGYTNPDGTFDGMVGALERKSIDFGSSPLFLRADRAQVIDYGRNTWILRFLNLPISFRVPMFFLQSGFHIQKSKITNFYRNIFASSVHLNLVNHRFASSYFNSHFESGHDFRKKAAPLQCRDLLECLCCFYFGSVLPTRYHFRDFDSCTALVVGSPSVPRMACGRITTISIFLLSIMIYQFYSASLVSHLLMKPITKITTIKSLLESSLKAGCQDILYDRDYFQVLDLLVVNLVPRSV